MGQGGFAGARLADDSKALPLFNGEGYSIEGLEFPGGTLVIDMGKVFDFDHNQWSNKPEFAQVLG